MIVHWIRTDLKSGGEVLPGLLWNFPSIPGHDDNLVDVLTVEVELFGQRDQSGLRVDVKVTLFVGLSSIN